MFFPQLYLISSESKCSIYGNTIAGKFLPPTRLVLEEGLFRILTGTLGSLSEIYYKHIAEVNLN